MSLIKEYLRETQEIKTELTLIDEEIRKAQRESCITDWILIDDNYNLDSSKSSAT
jgi:hypothetical protein